MIAAGIAVRSVLQTGIAFRADLMNGAVYIISKVGNALPHLCDKGTADPDIAAVDFMNKCFSCIGGAVCAIEACDTVLAEASVSDRRMPVCAQIVIDPDRMRTNRLNISGNLFPDILPHHRIVPAECIAGHRSVMTDNIAHR